jgi:hypothetical protein
MKKIEEEIKEVKVAIELAKKEIKEWQEFLKSAEDRLLKLKVVLKD